MSPVVVAAAPVALHVFLDVLSRKAPPRRDAPSLRTAAITGLMAEDGDSSCRIVWMRGRSQTFLIACTCCHGGLLA